MEIIWQIITAFFGTVSFSLIFNVPKKYFVYCGLAGAGGWLIYLLVNQLTNSFMATFFAALTVATLSRCFSVIRQCPVTLFLISGIFPLVPGAGIYYTAYEAINNNMAAAAARGIDTFKIGGAIVLGVVFILSIPRTFFMKKIYGHLTGIKY